MFFTAFLTWVKPLIILFIFLNKFVFFLKNKMGFFGLFFNFAGMETNNTENENIFEDFEDAEVLESKQNDLIDDKDVATEQSASKKNINLKDLFSNETKNEVNEAEVEKEVVENMMSEEDDGFNLEDGFDDGLNEDFLLGDDLDFDDKKQQQEIRVKVTDDDIFFSQIIIDLIETIFLTLLQYTILRKLDVQMSNAIIEKVQYTRKEKKILISAYSKVVSFYKMSKTSPLGTALAITVIMSFNKFTEVKKIIKTFENNNKQNNNNDGEDFDFTEIDEIYIEKNSLGDLEKIQFETENKNSKKRGRPKKQNNE